MCLHPTLKTLNNRSTDLFLDPTFILTECLSSIELIESD